MFNFLWYVVAIFTVILIVRMVFDFIKAFTNQWEPTGAVAIIHDIAYGTTNPVLKFVRKAAPSIKIGAKFNLDVAFLVTALLCSMLLIILTPLR